jgi:hypothetical protein
LACPFQRPCPVLAPDIVIAAYVWLFVHCSVRRGGGGSGGGGSGGASKWKEEQRKMQCRMLDARASAVLDKMQGHMLVCSDLMSAVTHLASDSIYSIMSDAPCVR